MQAYDERGPCFYSDISPGSQFTTQFTSFTSTKVQILTPGALPARRFRRSTALPSPPQYTTQFISFTSTKVQILTPACQAISTQHRLA